MFCGSQGKAAIPFILPEGLSILPGGLFILPGALSLLPEGLSLISLGVYYCPSGFVYLLRGLSRGQAFPQCVFDYWQILPGDHAW